jgi:hypothetical protein
VAAESEVWLVQKQCALKEKLGIDRGGVIIKSDRCEHGSHNLSSREQNHHIPSSQIRSRSAFKFFSVVRMFIGSPMVAIRVDRPLSVPCAGFTLQQPEGGIGRAPHRHNYGAPS